MEPEQPPGAVGEAEAAQAPAPGAATIRRQPLWTHFLTPAAVVIGAVIIAGAIWYTDRDGAPASTGADAAHTGATSTAPVTSAPADLRAALNGYARQVGLDTTKFQQCMGNEANAQLINRHLQRGAALGVTGTPTFFVNNKRIVGAQPWAIFEEVIRLELAGSPTSLDSYSGNVRQLAATNPPMFEIVSAKVDVSDANFEGSPQAKVVVAEFSDFQCPFCRRWVEDNLARFRALEGSGVALAFLHFPIAQIHANAGRASMAAICAGEQGKFAAMHDLLFARQQEWEKLALN